MSNKWHIIREIILRGNKLIIFSSGYVFKNSFIYFFNYMTEHATSILFYHIFKVIQKKLNKN